MNNFFKEKYISNTKHNYMITKVKILTLPSTVVIAAATARSSVFENQHSHSRSIIFLKINVYKTPNMII